MRPPPKFSPKTRATLPGGLRRDVPLKTDEPPAESDSGLVGVVAKLARRIGTLEARISALEPATDGELMSFIATRTAGHVFTLAELRTLARADGPTCVWRSLTGNRLRALANRHLHGFVLTKVKRGEGGCIWVVLHADAGHGSERNV